jgi:DNA-binding MarR family transcriptional regulator
MEQAQDFIDRAHAARQKIGRGIHVADTADLERVVRLAAYLERDLAEICVIHGLKTGQFQVLAELRGRDPMPMTASDLARAIVLTSGGMTPVLDQLEERGLINRQIDPEDRRARRITITEKGRSLIGRAMEQRLARHRALNAVLEAGERETLSNILRKLLVAMEGEVR